MFKQLKSTIPDFLVFGLFILVTLAYFYPVIEGKALPQLDNTKAIGMAKELIDYEKETGVKAQWTNSMFGGMPAYQIRGDSSANLFFYLNRTSRIGLPYHTAAILFLYLLGFYLLARSMGLSPWLSSIGAIAFGFGSYNIIIIIAGHITKAYAIALMAPVLGGILYTFNRNMWVGALFTTLALGAEIAYNHVQITYYLALLVAILMIDRFIRSYLKKDLKNYLKKAALLACAAFLAILPNITNLWTTWEYGKESIRGRSELSEEVNQQRQRGLDPDYAFAWSYGKAETATLMIPNFKGGGSIPLGASPETLDGIEERINQQLNAANIHLGTQQQAFVNQLANEVAQSSQYWGGKPFTSGPVYAGAFIIFLFILALFLYQGREKWWLLGGTILSILLAWGNNLEWFNMFMFNHFPLYNKFRTVEMALVIASLTIPILALLGLKEVIDNPIRLKQKSNQFLITLGLTGGTCILFYLYPHILSLLNTFEWSQLTAQKQANPEQAIIYDILMNELKHARAVLLKNDAFRSFVFIALGSGSLWFYATNKINKRYLLPGIILLILVDLWAVDRRYLNSEHFVSAREVRTPYQATKVDRTILEDEDPNFRVFAIFRNAFNDSHTSYFHKSIGGYHGAKLQRYQDVIDHYLQPSYRQLQSTLQATGNPEALLPVLAQSPAINMLNTKYIAYDANHPPLLNPYAMGHAWLVDDVYTVESTKQELMALQKADLTKQAVVHMDFADILRQTTTGDGYGEIELVEHAPEYLKYQSRSESTKLAVFSEIHYTGGWKAYVNGEATPIIRVNYLLRGVFIPEGESIIEFKFKPLSYRYGKIVATLSSLLIVALVIGTIIVLIKRKKTEQE